MAKQNKNQQEDEVLVDVGQSISKVEAFFEENSKSVTLIVGALIVVVAGYFAYTNWYQLPRENDAKDEIYHAQEYFEQDSLKLALNGDGTYLGFIDVAEDYSGTKAGNMAHYYAGISYLNLGEFQNAIEHLDNFSSNHPIYSVIAKGAIGDAFLELDQPSDALDYYKRAVSGESNQFVVPFYLKKAAVVAQSEGDFKLALKYYKRIETEFGESNEASDIAKFIALAEAKLK